MLTNVNNIAINVSASTNMNNFNNLQLSNLEKKYQLIDDFMQPNQTVLCINEIFDFSNNKFELYELAPAGYAIYSIKNDARIFLEGSLTTNSPYLNFKSYELKYLGFGEYYYKKSDKYINLITNKSYNQNELCQSYNLPDETYYNIPIEKKLDLYQTNNQNASTYSTGFPSTPQDDVTVDLNGFIRIKNHSYFETLTQFPNNINGTCGLVAICITLGYLDEYVNDNFIKDNVSFRGSPLKIGNGTSQAFHDYLFSKYMHTIGNIGSDSFGYPMGDIEIENTVKDYVNATLDISFTKKVKYYNTRHLYTHATPREFINGGLPAILTLAKCTISASGSSSTTKAHNVVAYGYNKENDTFLVHAGWSPNTTKYTTAIISDATINSVNAFWCE